MSEWKNLDDIDIVEAKAKNDASMLKHWMDEQQLSGRVAYNSNGEVKMTYFLEDDSFFNITDQLKEEHNLDIQKTYVTMIFKYNEENVKHG